MKEHTISHAHTYNISQIDIAALIEKRRKIGV